jgi:dTDP-4-dehydrorhamnose reductase
MKIFITGSEGQLGRALQQFLDGHDIYPAARKDHDVASPAIVESIANVRPDVVIHAGAMTDVDGCEKNETLAYRINAYGTQNVVNGAERAGADLVYISTDYVFDGMKGTPYFEWDRPNPLSVYGKSKLGGEWAVRHLSRRFYIVRSSWLYGRTGKNFVRTMLRLADERDELRVVDDQTGNPTFVEPLAVAIGKLIATRAYGLYHAVSDDYTTWYDFTQEILRLSGKKTPVLPMTSRELGRPAPRPVFSALRNTSLKALGITIPSWKTQLAEFFRT